MAVELGGVHALDLGHTGLVLSLVLNTDRVFKDVRPFGQVVDEKVTGRVAS